MTPTFTSDTTSNSNAWAFPPFPWQGFGPPPQGSPFGPPPGFGQPFGGAQSFQAGGFSQTWWSQFGFRPTPPAPPRPRPMTPAERTTLARKILGVGCEAAMEEVRRAYRRLAKIAHPDAGGSNGWMVALNRLYELARA